MATLNQQLQKAKSLNQQAITKELFLFIRSIEKEFLDRNKEQIQEDSKDIFGNPIGFYSQATEIITKGSKKAGEPFDGKNTGKWLDAFKMQEVSGVLRFTSTDEKNQLILNSDNWLSDELFGLSDKNLKEVISKLLLPFLLTQIRDTLDI